MLSSKSPKNRPIIPIFALLPAVSIEHLISRYYAWIVLPTAMLISARKRLIYRANKFMHKGREGEMRVQIKNFDFTCIYKFASAYYIITLICFCSSVSQSVSLSRNDLFLCNTAAICFLFACLIISAREALRLGLQVNIVYALT